MSSIAVIGAGVYGCTIAIELAQAGHSVDLYELHRDLLHGATRANQGRLHSGYHYPRSPETAKAALVDAERFAARFPDAIDRSNRHYYCIAADSKTGYEAYRRFCNSLGKLYHQVEPELVHSCGFGVQVDEALIDFTKLREQLRRELRESRVSVHFNTLAHPNSLDHGAVIRATYGRSFPSRLRYEVTEVVRIELGPHYAKKSFVILDGEYVSLDPIPGTRFHMLYDVAASVHAVSEGSVEVPEHLLPLLDRGPVLTEHNRADMMLSKARRFFKRIGLPVYQGSLFTVRAVLPGVDATDERPTLVHHDGRSIHVLSGKIDGAVTAAKHVTEMIA